jgi:two-component system NtrC family sensor kinase
MAGETVLVIEDRRENIVHLANNVLKPNGYNVITAMDGQRGLKRAVQDQPDLIIMDLNMPKMDGLEVLAALQEQEVDIPVILSTFYGSEQVAQKALSLGAVAYVVKPYAVNDMLDAVKKALAGRSTLPPMLETAPEPAKPVQAISQPVQELDEPMPLTRQVERWMRDMNILTKVGKALVALLELDRVCTRSVEAAIYVTRSDHAFLFLMEEDRSELRLRAARASTDHRAHLISQPVESKIASQVARTGQAVLEPEAPEEIALAEITGELLGSLVAVPLRCQQETYGVLVAARRPSESPFHESDVEWLNGLADYAAIAVSNARAFQQRAPLLSPSTLNEEMLSAVELKISQLAEELEAATQTLESLTTLLRQQDRGDI